MYSDELVKGEVKLSTYPEEKMKNKRPNSLRKS